MAILRRIFLRQNKRLRKQILLQLMGKGKCTDANFLIKETEKLIHYINNGY